MDKDYLALKRASISRPSGEWNDDDFDVVCDGVVVGRIMKAAAAPVGEPWLWTLAFGQHEDRWPTHGYEATRDAAMAAFAKSWRGEEVYRCPVGGKADMHDRVLRLPRWPLTQFGHQQPVFAAMHGADFFLPTVTSLEI